MKDNIDELNDHIDLADLGDILYLLCNKMELNKNLKFNNRNLKNIASVIEDQYGYGVKGLIKAMLTHLI